MTTVSCAEMSELDLSTPVQRADRRPAIELRDVRRSFGRTVALDGATFSVSPGTVTGFVGPNGAGKTTAIRILLGLDRADGGEALVDGRPFRELERPGRTVGAVLDSAGFHPGRSGRAHLRAHADLVPAGHERVDELLEAVGLEGAADRAVGGYSLGMRRRLALATALLGEPAILVLDEPTNGLDPAGTRWLRELVRNFASDGGTVLVSSHVLAEVAHVAEEVVVIKGGRVVAEARIEDLAAANVVHVRTRNLRQLSAALQRSGAQAVKVDGDLLAVAGATPEEVGLVAAAERIPLIHLSVHHRSLEELFFDLTEDGR